ncbi:MAG: hypothetical protein SV775_19290, partial [Thermodesulfobacteriota bacterium]|nr:hypothetical protein [Thermodesulfobacteriota bacterium]
PARSDGTRYSTQSAPRFLAAQPPGTLGVTGGKHCGTTNDEKALHILRGTASQKPPRCLPSEFTPLLATIYLLFHFLFSRFFQLSLAVYNQKTPEAHRCQ